jgi:hypothetical protein
MTLMLTLLHGFPPHQDVDRLLPEPSPFLVEHLVFNAILSDGLPGPSVKGILPLQKTGPLISKPSPLVIHDLPHPTNR